MYRIGKIVLCLVVAVAVIRVSCRSPDIAKFSREVDRREQGGRVFYGRIKQNILSRLDLGSGALAIAYLLGDRTELTSSQKESIRDIGITHLIVVSGLHLEILVGVLLKVLKRFSKFLKVYFCCLFLLLYMELIGATPSLLRAAIVAFCHLFVDYFGRTMKSERIIVLVLSVTLIINPNYIEDIGWQLSMLAYIGILVFYPLIESFLFGKGNNRRGSKIKQQSPKTLVGFLTNKCSEVLTEIRKRMNLKSGILISVAVNLTVLPMLLYHFGSFSLLSIIVTLILSPILPTILLSVGMIGILPSLIYRKIYFLAIGGVLGLKLQILLMKVLEDYQNLSISWPKHHWSSLLLYVFVGLLYFFLKNKNVKVGNDDDGKQDGVIEGSDGMQQIGAYLVEWQEQLELRRERYKNEASIKNTLGKTEKSG